MAVSKVPLILKEDLTCVFCEKLLPPRNHFVFGCFKHSCCRDPCFGEYLAPLKEKSEDGEINFIGCPKCPHIKDLYCDPIYSSTINKTRENLLETKRIKSEIDEKCKEPSIVPPKCNCCDKEAHVRCISCNIVLCCVHDKQIHDSCGFQTATLPHSRHTLSSEDHDLLSRHCSIHKSKELEFYCSKDKELVCTFCLLVGSHKGHDAILLENAVEDMKPAISTLRTTLNHNLEEDKNFLTSLEGTRDKLIADREIMIEDLNTKIDDLKKVLDEIKEELIENITNNQDEKLNSICSHIIETKSKIHELEMSISEIPSENDPNLKIIRLFSKFPTTTSEVPIRKMVTPESFGANTYLDISPFEDFLRTNLTLNDDPILISSSKIFFDDKSSPVHKEFFVQLLNTSGQLVTGPLKVEIKIKGPTDREEMVYIYLGTFNEGRKYRFYPKEFGQYKIDVTYGGNPLPGSPLICIR